MSLYYILLPTYSILLPTCSILLHSCSILLHTCSILLHTCSVLLHTCSILLTVLEIFDYLNLPLHVKFHAFTKFQFNPARIYYSIEYAAVCFCMQQVCSSIRVPRKNATFIVTLHFEWFLI